MIYFIHLFIVLECKLLMRTLTVLFKWYPDIIRLNKYLLNQQGRVAQQREILQGSVPRESPSGGLRHRDVRSLMTHTVKLWCELSGRRGRLNEQPGQLLAKESQASGLGIIVCCPEQMHHSFNSIGFTQEFVRNVEF